MLAGAAAAAAARVLHARCLRASVVSRVSTRGTTTAARTGLDAADFYVAQRQLRWLGHVSRMDFGRLPRRMLSAWVPHQRPVGATRLTYGRAMGKAIWTSLTCLTLRAGTSLWATGLWRTMLSEGIAPFRFRAPPPPPLPMPISHFLARPRGELRRRQLDCDHELSRRSRSISCERRAPRRR